MEIDTTYFEKILIKNAILDSTYLSTIVDYVKPIYFEDPTIERYFEIVKEFYEKRNEIPSFTEIKTYLKDDKQREQFKKLILGFKDLDDKNKEELYSNTEKFLKERAVYTTLQNVVEELQSGDELDTNALLHKFEDSCNINLVMDMGMELHADIDKLIAYETSDEKRISTGWPWIDKNIGGGYKADGKMLTVFAGQPNIGKSIFLGNAAANIAEQGKNVLVISLEMSEMLYAKRICSNVTKIPINEFRFHTDAIQRKIKKDKMSRGKIFIKEFPPSTVTPKQIAAFIKKFKDCGERIDAIVIDYMNLLHSPIGNNSYERIKYISEQLRAMSYIFACPVITATQLTRNSFNVDNPGMEGISESVGTAATADLILSIFQNEEDMEMDVIRLGMMKNRMGPRGMVKIMTMDWKTLTVLETEGVDYGEEMNEEELSILEKFEEVSKS